MGAELSKSNLRANGHTPKATTKDGKIVLGENVIESRAAKNGAYSDFSILSLPPPVLCVFDNKTVSTDQPKLGILQNGVAIPITEGDSDCLIEADMESISLVDADKGLYVACAALGATHVFTLEQTGGTSFRVNKVATGQLPVPSNESTESWQDENRTNIEAVRCHTRADGTVVIGWGARGGEHYAGAEVTSDYVWLRWAPFDATTGNVDETQLQETTLKNVGANNKWRALSAMDISGDYLYFTSAYDGEEDGNEMNYEDAARVSDENKAAMKSLVARASIITGETEVLTRFEGLKAEAINVIEDTGDQVKCLVASDDEGMGSLIGTVAYKTTRCGHLEEAGPIRFVDVAKSSSFYAVEQKRWGTSGIAPLCFKASE